MRPKPLAAHARKDAKETAGALKHQDTATSAASAEAILILAIEQDYKKRWKGKQQMEMRVVMKNLEAQKENLKIKKV